MSLATLSAIMLYSAFGLYSIATIIFGMTIKDKNKQEKTSKTGTIAISLTILGLAAQITYFITRWIVSGHAPLSNLFEFMRSEEHTSELQSRGHLVCRLLLENKTNETNRSSI